MVQAFFGWLGSVVGLISLAVAGSVAVTITFILLKSGTMPEAWTTLQVLLNGAFGALGSFWDFLKSVNNAI